jgi:hypothetical protein
MDPRVLAPLIPIVAIMCFTVIRLAKIRAGQQQLGDRTIPDVLARLEQHEEELAALRQELAETQERLDFTERLLTRGKASAGEG